jgi:hypothetical protein
MTSHPTNPGQPPEPSGSQPTRPAQSPEAAQKTSYQLPKTWQFGIRGEQGVSQKTTTPMQDDFKLPLKRVGVVFVGLFATVWLVSVVYGMVTGLFSGRKPQVVASPAATVPEQVKTDSCSGMTAKMSAAKVTSKQVDKIFWQKHPDKLNKLIGNDAVLRQEWCQIAGELAGKK